MSVNDLTDSNLPTVEEDARGEYTVVGARVERTELREIDLARVKGGYDNRSELLLAALRAMVQRILSDAA